MAWVVLAAVIGAAVGALGGAWWQRRRSEGVARQDRARLVGAEARRRRASSRCGPSCWRAIDGLPQGVVIVDRDGEVVVRNRQAEHMLGVAHLDALVDEAVEAHLRAARAGRETSDTLDVMGPPRCTLVIRGSVVSVAGQQVGAMCTIEDVSERTRLDSVRTDLVANISHELKTPVGAIALLAETLADEDEPEVIARLAPKLIAEAERLSRIIDELLELSRIELGGQSLAEVVDVESVVREAMVLHAPLAQTRGIPCSSRRPPQPRWSPATAASSCRRSATCSRTPSSTPTPALPVEVTVGLDGSGGRGGTAGPRDGDPRSATSAGCSSASTGSTRPAAARRAGAASASRSSATSWPTTADRWTWCPSRARARRSRCGSPPRCLPPAPTSRQAG